jgi:catechol 2,3-dioxygenase-like lactoylglutathione lyase family enzyme
MTRMAAQYVTPDLPPISAIVPMIRVADIERSILFYRRLGFEVGNYVPRDEGEPKHWAWLYAPKAPNWKRGPNLMLVASECAIEADAQEVLFYLYAADLPSLRSQLLAAGVEASEISYPEYLPNGEMRVPDPDGYTLMIAQAAEDTP